jgi:hypothetical protein
MKKQKSGGDEVLKDLFTRMEVVEPSEGFTDRVMNRIAVEKSPSADITRPLISRPMWVVLGVLFAGLITVVIIAGQGVPGYISQYVNLDYSFNLELGFIEKFVQIVNTSFTSSTSTVSYVLLGVILASLLFMVDRLISNFRSISRY